MKILVTGCNGQLGRAVNEQYAGNENVELINTDVDQLDITNVDDVLKMVRGVKPDVILNCAAHTNVNLCESQQDLAYRINAIGPRNLSIAAADVDAKMVQVSTDYVFAGDGNRPYTEFDPTDPQSMYGATKLAGEQFVQQFAKRYFIIRTAWLYGDGKNFVKTMLQLSENNDKVRVVGDQLGTPTSAAELARMIKYLIPTENYGIFHGTCEGVCSWADFTKEIFRLAGKKTEVEYITTDEFPTPAKRPAYSVLENYMLKLTTDYSFAQWEDAIAEYMKWLLG
ncbi:dTDP-4-dehydrorhamnose reductase [Murimonas intestini]|uniref:dTDP-4-dehydrorhamnose reductase n=1 Tax=Murimonas intestini TaxID=1337051 RepID=A0AB73SZA7_9FIRM|nr:dTDP-4-dehydrorhamnose reductase [Murimonas intestini]MCR1842990.1 dTDP-4-dehydrorhamnose reductase [Murimonas intestini]MCR1867991.1 dTDP-4-dehydrorhamnose reductase [Murimonas intestini]MCR1885459.1 dTDP-4-dehydrorhamnose reductase [Murimonas intestini]